MTIRKFALGVAMAVLSSTVIAHFAEAADWPLRPVRILVGFPAGSTPDLVARTLSDPLAKAIGQPVIVENKPGASGNIATDQIAKASDDHTIGVVINGNLTSSKMLYPSLPYDPENDFSFLSLLATSPLALVTQPGAPDGAAFFTAARQAGDKWSYGSVGIGSLGHLGMELLKTRVDGMNALHVPYQGNPAVLADLISAQVQMALVPPGLAAAQAKAGKLKVIGITSARSPLAPESPSLSESGIRDFNLEVWTGLVGPAKLSGAALERLNKEIPAIMQGEEVRQKLFTQGWQALGSSGEAFRARVKTEAEQLGAIIRAKNIKID